MSCMIFGSSCWIGWRENVGAADCTSRECGWKEMMQGRKQMTQEGGNDHISLTHCSSSCIYSYQSKTTVETLALVRTYLPENTRVLKSNQNQKDWLIFNDLLANNSSTESLQIILFDSSYSAMRCSVQNGRKSLISQYIFNYIFMLNITYWL